MGKRLRHRVDQKHTSQQQPTNSFTNHVAFLYALGANVEDTLQAFIMVRGRQNDCDVLHISEIFY
jgi:hypothetical protein